MDSLPPIPTPASQRWREFRIQVMPVAVFVVTVVTVVMLWRTYVLPASIVGMVQTNSVSITSAEPGMITDMFVKPFEGVTNGQLLCVVRPFSPELTRASMDKIAADMNVLRGRLALNDLRNTESIAKLRLDLFDQQTQLAIAKVRLEEAEIVLDRKTKLLQDNIIPQAEFEIAKAQRDAYKSEVTDRTRLVEAWDVELAALKPLQTNDTANIDKLIQEAITKQQEELNALYHPIELRSPMDGQVGEIFQLAGQHTLNRQPILTINSIRSDRIIAFVRQPIALRPQVGDYVTIRTRGNHRQQIAAQITQVGVQLEPINPVLLPWSNSRRAVEMGLPVAINLPPELKLMPGELVELALAARKQPAQ
jgi:multidrug resistance efflux pump